MHVYYLKIEDINHAYIILVCVHVVIMHENIHTHENLCTGEQIEGLLLPNTAC